ncbi:MAG TPA: alpha/beta hydrolase [Pseudolysinimonas sp.]|jgi:pimeloyl-ACP methyl ester carboxylesterase
MRARRPLRRPTARRSLGRRAALAATIAVAALILSGCTFFPGATGSTQTATTHTDETVPSNLKRFYDQSLTWKKLSGGIDSTYVTVPLSWDDPTGATIKIAVARHSAGSGKIGSLLINPGGPGGSGFDFVDQAVNYIVTPAVLKKYDIIGFDPRGVGRSEPAITCYTDPKQEDQLLYGTYPDAYGTQAWIDDLTVVEKNWAAACLKNTGPLLGHIDAESNARDMDVIRAVLGDKTMHYLGYSYGTYLGTMYAELFPKKVGRMVLDGPIDPLVGQLDSLATQMAGFDSALKSYMAYCLAQKGCPFTGTVDEGLQQVRAVLDGIDARHLMGSDGRAVDSATVGTGISYTLYSEDSWPDLTTMFQDLAKGDADSTLENADGYNDRSANGTYDNETDVYAAVTCAESDIGHDGVTPLEGLTKIDKAAPILGKYFAYDDYAVLDTACSNWPEPVAKLPTTFDAVGAAPIMVVATTNDPATPYAGGVSLSKQLSSGVLVTHKGEGHTVYAQGDSCVDTTVDDYLINGTVPQSDPMCD